MKESVWSGTLFWGTFFLMILSLCGNFVSDRKDKSIMPHVTDYINKFYPQEESRPTPMNVPMNGHAWETIWNGMAPRDEDYFIDLAAYDHRRRHNGAAEQVGVGGPHEIPSSLLQSSQVSQPSQAPQELNTTRTISRASST